MINKLSALVVFSFLLNGCFAGHPKPVENAYETDYERFFQNVIVKEKTPYHVTYEYKDVRLDEVAYLASRYCYEQDGRTAYLHDSVLYHNFTRRATFDCLELQN